MKSLLKRYASLAFALVLTLGLVPVMSTDADAASVISNIAGGTYFIQCAVAGQTQNSYLDFRYGTNARGEDVIGKKFTNGACQKWTFENAGNGYYYIKNGYTKGYLTLDGSSSACGLGVIVRAKSNYCYQKWQLIALGNGYFNIRSEKGTYLELFGGLTYDGTDAWVWKGNGGTAQKWKLLSAAPKAGQTVYLKSYLGNLWLDVQGANKNSGANVWVYGGYGSAAQRWTLEDAGNGYFYLKNGLGNYLTIQSGGRNVQAVSLNRSNSQKWKFVGASNGSFYLQSASGYLWLDVAGSNAQSRTNVQVYGGYGSAVQRWKLVQS